MKKVSLGKDFYTVSSVRDLIFNEQEHCFSIPEISKTILINFPESCIAEDLEIIQKKFNNIEIGSYPFMNGKKKGVNVVLKGRNLNQVRSAEKEIKKIIKLL